MINMISLTTFDNYEKQPRLSTETDSKPEDFAAFLSVPVAPLNFQSPQNKDASESSETLPETSIAEFGETISTIDPKINSTDVWVQPNTGQTSFSVITPTKFPSPGLLNYSSPATRTIQDKTTASEGVQSSFSPDSVTKSDLNQQEPISSAQRTTTPQPFIKIVPLVKHMPGIKPLLIKMEVADVTPGDEPIQLLVPNQETINLTLSQAKLQNVKPDVCAFDMETTKTKVSENELNNKLNAETFGVKTSGAEDVKTKLITGTFAAEPSEIVLTNVKKITETPAVEPLEAKSTESDNIPANTESDFSFNFDKFLSSVTKQLKVIVLAPTNSIGSPTTLEQIEPQMLQIVSMMNDENEKKTMKMRLHPAELGMIEIKLEKNADGKIVAHFQTETEAARLSLAQNIEQLRSSLQNSGWQIERLDVTCQQFSPDGGEHHANHSQSEKGERSPGAKTAFDRHSDEQNDLNPNQPDRLLSVRA